ncbi:MAG: hypothetical protein RLZZ76_243 [Candidatus Parcubacteria bacterium]|jgi:hypothetical protein
MKITGVMHVHSTYSYDGKESLTSLRELFLSKGHSFCFVTEHTDALTPEKAALFVQECKSLTTGSFVFIPGFEVPYRNAHILMLGSCVFLGQKADAQMLRQWSEHAELTVLAHPVRNNFVLDSVMEEVIDGVEVWNAQYDGKLVPRTRAVKLYKELQQKKQSLLATGGLDFHRTEHLGAPVLTLDTETCTERDIIQTIQSGSYSFGTSLRSVSSASMWPGKGSATDIVLSLFSITTISIGKLTNKLLAKLGIKLPKKLARTIRKKI